MRPTKIHNGLSQVHALLGSMVTPAPLSTSSEARGPREERHGRQASSVEPTHRCSHFGTSTQQLRPATNVVLLARALALGTSFPHLAPDLHRGSLRSVLVRSPSHSNCLYAARCVAYPRHRPYAAHCTAYPDLTHRPCRPGARLFCVASRRRLIEPLPTGTHGHPSVFICRRRLAQPSPSSSCTSQLQREAVLPEHILRTDEVAAGTQGNFCSSSSGGYLPANNSALLPGQNCKSCP